MAIQLLPTDFDAQVTAAIRAFWATRTVHGTSSQEGSRGSVISGKNMDGFIELVRSVAAHCGLPETSVLTTKARVILPGYFRATKNWDVLVIHERRLIAVFEFKSQVGSFGNNFNNRAEEVLGAAADLWVAHHHGAYSDDRDTPEVITVNEPTALLHPDLRRDPRPPFLGWLMLLEECARSTTPVTASEPNYKVFGEFEGASYARRYELLCERLVERQLYGSAALVLSRAGEGAPSGAYRSMSDATSLRTLFTEFAARAAAAAATR